MRFAIAALALFAIPACGQSAETAPAAPAEQSFEEAATAIAPQDFVLETEAVVGQWSFDRDCGLYDLVFYADANVYYFDYSTEGQVVSYAGQWGEERDNNRVTLELRRLDAQNQATGETLSYVLDIITPVTDDLNGRFGRADGTFGRNIHARRCPEEDRD